MTDLTDAPVESPFKQVKTKIAVTVTRSSNTGNTGTPYVELWDDKTQLVCRFESGHPDHKQWTKLVSEAMGRAFPPEQGERVDLLPNLKVTFQRRMTGTADHPSGISKAQWENEEQREEAEMRKWCFDLEALGNKLHVDASAIITSFRITPDCDRDDYDAAVKAIRALAKTDAATVHPDIAAATQLAQDYEAQQKRMNDEQHAQEVANSAQSEAENAIAALKESGDAIDDFLQRDENNQPADKPVDRKWSWIWKQINDTYGPDGQDMTKYAAGLSKDEHVHAIFGLAKDGSLKDLPATWSDQDVVNEFVKRCMAIKRGETPMAKTETQAPPKQWWLDDEKMKLFHAKLDARAASRGIHHDDVMVMAQKAVGVDFVGDFKGTGAQFIAAVIHAWDTEDARTAQDAETMLNDASEDVNEIEGGGDVDDRSEPSAVMQPDAIIRSTGELVPLNRDANAAIIHVKSSKALVDHMFSDKVLVAGVDYGTLPGAREGAKPSLLKPGAEKLLDAFQFYPEFKPTSNTVCDWKNGFFNFEYDCVIRNRLNMRVEGSGIGSCNSMESKYRYRWLYDNEVKALGKDYNILPRKEFTSKAGKQYFKYRVENEDIYDQVNTLSKMAQKRALVAATLNATGASAVFTQDTEDFADWGMVD